MGRCVLPARPPIRGSSGLSPFFQLSTIFTLLPGHVSARKAGDPQSVGIAPHRCALSPFPAAAGHHAAIQYAAVCLLAWRDFHCGAVGLSFQILRGLGQFLGTTFWTFVGEGIFGGGYRSDSRYYLPAIRESF